MMDEHGCFVENQYLTHLFPSRSAYAKLVKCSNDTAFRDIQDLKTRGVLIQNSSGGRSTSYRLTDRVELSLNDADGYS